MRKISLLAISFFLTSLLDAQSTYFKWASQFQDGGTDIGEKVKVDPAGNVYTSGTFQGTVDFDPGPGVFNMTASGTLSVFISKLNANGHFIWAKSIIGPSYVAVKSLTVDPAGNIYITGGFADSVDFDPGPGVFKLIADGSAVDIFILKLNANGDFVWAKQIKASSNKESLAACGDAEGNIYLTGYFTTPTDFDPGPGVSLLTPAGGFGIFIAKFDPSGSLVWARAVSSDDEEKPTGISIDPAENIYLTGYFSGAVDFDPGTGNFFLASNGASDIFVLKLNSNGDFIWARSMGGTRDDHGYTAVPDATGNVYVTGFFEGISDFDPGPGEYDLTCTGDGIFVVKLDADGNLIWAKSMAGPATNNWGFDLCLDNSGHVYVTGHFNGSVDFDPGPASVILNSSFIDLFILKLDDAGNFIWVRSIGGTGDDQSHSIDIDKYGNIYTTGPFGNTVDFDPDAGIYNLTATISEDVFVEKIGQCPNSSGSTLTASSCTAYTLNGQTYNTSGEYTQTLYNALGCDSIITLHLSISSIQTNIAASICEGQSYFAGGADQTVSGIYRDTILTSSGCDSIITTNLVVHPKPVADLGPDHGICLNVPVVLNPGNFVSYIWQDNSTGPVFTTNAEGKYWVTVTDAAHCTVSDTINISGINSIPKDFLPVDPVICLGNPLVITINGYKNYLWSTGAVTGNISILNPGRYFLTVTDLNDCKGTDTIIVKRSDCGLTGIPGAFSPNGDGLNDIFRPIIGKAVLHYDFAIFNRYGTKIFETKEYGKGWDGNYLGLQQLPGAYIYVISYTDLAGSAIEKKGSILLVR